MVALVIGCCLASAQAAAIKTELVQQDGKWELLRDGQPYFIRGAGGDQSKQLLLDLGGNSVRTWGSDNLGPLLDEAQKLGLSVTVGIALAPERSGFSYNDPAKVAAQYERARNAILKYKGYPAVLMWGIGNEMEGYKDGGNPAVWAAVNNIASMAKMLDPDHPTMTVIAEIGGQRIKCIDTLCPDIDIVGINTYGGIVNIAARYKQLGATKPYVITEFGPVGTWESGRNGYHSLIEPTSTQKAAFYRQGYQAAIASQTGLCLGSYCFLWGQKQESTSTWFGMFLPDGTRLEQVEAIHEMWTGQPATVHAPRIDPIQIVGSDTVAPGQTINATVKVTDPDGHPFKVDWQLHHEPLSYGVGGDYEPPTKQYPDAIVAFDNDHVQLKMPADAGAYRLYAIVRDDQHYGATANIPLLVKTDAAASTPTPAVPAAATAQPTPVVTIYADDAPPSPYIPSGWMGNIAAISMDPKCTTDPHSGATCLKCQYTAADNFGGVVWQSPANNWGDQDGGKNLTGATKLTFWARGEVGGEKIEFKFGVIGKDKKFSDTASGDMTVTLDKTWKQYSFDLSNKDLSKIITGFCWVMQGQGAPVTFYLDDVRYE